MSSSQDKIVLVTGVSSGIGRATALYLAEKGYRVIGTGRSKERLEDLQAEASRRSLPLVPVVLDINSDEAVDRVLPTLADEHGAVDVLVNNAGYSLWGPIQHVSMPDVKAQFETNLFAAVRLTKAVLPEMVRRRHGTIVNVSSVLGRIGTPLNAAYASSKFALEGLSEALRGELWPLGVRVAVVEPALIRTALHENQVVGVGVDADDSPYAPSIKRYRSRRGLYDRRAGDARKVAKVIHGIVRSRRPAFRHPVGLEAKLGILGARLMPERLFQAMVRRATTG